MSNSAVTFLISRLAIASVEFLIVGFAVALLLALLPNIGPRWRRRIWFIALCKPFITVFTASLNGVIPFAPAVVGTLLGDVLFPESDFGGTLSEGAVPAVVMHTLAYIWMAMTAALLIRVWFRASASRQEAEDHLSKGYLLKPTSIRRLDPNLSVPPSTRIIVTPEDAGPATLGVFHPAILIPEALLPWVLRHRDPTPEERARFCQVLRHELAHIANRDDLLTLATLIMLSFFWFHPMAHWAYRRVRMNNELCCDEDVVDSGVHPAEYVNTLMTIVASRLSGRSLAMHILGDSSPAGVLRRRLHYILRQRTAQRGRPIGAYIAIGVVVLTLPRFLGHGSMVEVLMRTGETRLVSRAELHDMGPELIDRVITPGVVDDTWYHLPMLAAAPDSEGPAPAATASGVSPLVGDALAFNEAQAEAAPVQGPMPADAEVLAKPSETVAAAAEQEPPAPTTPKRKARSAVWPPETTVVGTGPATPILPPANNGD